MVSSMLLDANDFPEEVKPSAANRDEDLSSSIEVGVFQKDSSYTISATSNFQSDEQFSPCNEGQEVNLLIKDGKDAIINTGQNTHEECQTLSLQLDPLETVEFEGEDLRRQDSDENVHIDYNANQLEVACIQSDLPQQLTKEEVGSSKKDNDKETLANENGTDTLHANNCSIKEAVPNEEHQTSCPGVVVTNRGAHDGARSIGVWKHVISKSNAGKTCKVVRREVDVQNASSQCSGSRISRTPYRKNSPLNWFPRKKTESYLERKIRMLQEADGMRVSLDETLVGSNIRLSRVEREKRAVQAAAKQAMETRKAALVEASWCRILEAARIPCSLAVLELEKAEKKASEALATAAALGVIMKNHPGSSKYSCECDASNNEEGSNLTVTASFETAFEVDKEVAAAVKAAFCRLAHLPGSTHKDFVDLDPDKGRRENQDAVDAQSDNGTQSPGGLDRKACSTEACSEAEIQPNPGLDRVEDGTDSIKLNMRAVKVPLHNKVSKEPPSPQELSEDLVRLMLERLKFLTSTELASLEQIVATRGLGALLREQNMEQEANANSNDGGLADVLVKHVSRLEAEKAAACKSTFLSRACKKKDPFEGVPDLGSVLVKHVSKLEKEVQEAKKSFKAEKHKCPGRLEQKVESLDQVLVKHTSKLEREKLAAVSAKTLEAHKNSSAKSCTADGNRLGLGDILKKCPSNIKTKSDEECDDINKENKDVNTASEISSLGVIQISLDAVKCKSVLDEYHEQNVLQSEFSSLDEYSPKFEEGKIQGHRNKKESMEQVEGLEKALIKQMSRLEKQNLAAVVAADTCDAHRSSTLNNSISRDYNCLDFDQLTAQDNTENTAGKNKVEIANVVENSMVSQSGNSSIEKVYSGVANVEKMDTLNLSSTGIPDLGSILIKRVSKFEEEIQAAKGTSKTAQCLQRRQFQHENDVESLDKILVKRLSRLEKEKLAASVREASQSRSNLSMTSSDAFAPLLKNQTGADYIRQNGIFNEDGSKTIRISNRVDAEVQVSNMEISESSCTLTEQEKQDKISCSHSFGKGNTIGMSDTVPFQNVVKRMSRLENEEKEAAGIDPWQKQKNARAEELQCTWGGLDLGNSLKRHFSRLELEQAAWRRAEEEERRKPPHH